MELPISNVKHHAHRCLLHARYVTTLQRYNATTLQRYNVTAVDADLLALKQLKEKHLLVIEQKKKHLQDLLLQQIALKNLIKRNEEDPR